MKRTEMSTTKPGESQCRIKQGRTPRSKMAKRTHFKVAFNFFYIYINVFVCENDLIIIVSHLESLVWKILKMFWRMTDIKETGFD